MQAFVRFLERIHKIHSIEREAPKKGDFLCRAKVVRRCLGGQRDNLLVLQPLSELSEFSLRQLR